MYNQILFLLLLRFALAFRSVEDYYFNIGVEEKLRDIRLLSNGEESTVYLFKDEPQSYFFSLDVNDGPVTVVVTPCSSRIEWKVYYHTLISDRKSSGLEGDPLHLQESGYPGEVARSTSFQHLFSYEGTSMSSYRTNHEYFTEGYLRIVLVSKDDNSRVGIIATDDQEQDTFPQLPTISDIDIIANDRNSVTVAWKPSPSNYQKGVRIKYCLAFNPRYNYQTLCALKEALDGRQPPIWPKNAGFGFTWEATWKQRIANLRRSMFKSAKSKRDIYFECVGGRQWASVNSLLPEKRYYVDVFAIDEYTNRSVAYPGKTFTTKSTGDAGIQALRPGVVYTFNLDEHHSSDVVYRSYAFQLKSDAIKNVAVFVQGCQPRISTEIIYEGAVVVKDVNVVNIQKILLKEADAGNYTLRFNLDNLDRSLSKQIKVCFMYGTEKCPFNAAPSDYRLIVKNKNQTSMSNCHKSTLTVQWTSASNYNARYCLYVQKLDQSDESEEEEDVGLTYYYYDDDDRDDENVKPKCGVFRAPLLSSSRLFCRQYKRNSPNRKGKLIKEILNLDLEANRVYRFRMQMMFKTNITIDYEPTEMLIHDFCR